jgi:hypothetical protein
VQLHRNCSTIRSFFAWIGLRIRDFQTSCYKNINRFDDLSNVSGHVYIMCIPDYRHMLLCDCHSMCTLYRHSGKRKALFSLYRIRLIQKKLWWFHRFILKNICALCRKQSALILARIRLKIIQVQDQKNYCRSCMLKNLARIELNCTGHTSFVTGDI